MNSRTNLSGALSFFALGRGWLLGALLAFAAASQAEDYRLEVVAEGLNHPWAMAFLPGGDYLVSMKAGEVRRISAEGEVGEPIAGGPATWFAGQGGYFDIALAPDFSKSSLVYLAYAGGDRRANRTTIMRARLAGNRFEDAKTIFAASPDKDTSAHYGGKLLFLADGTLLLTTGDGFEYREAAQSAHSHLGKVIRINADGSAPEGNPYAAGGGDPLVYSLGHRNPQGLALDPATGAIYLHEHGPKGGDEVNLIKPGHNYGWPAVSYGVNYSGALVSPFTQAPGITDPLHYWVPSIAPSGLVFYTGKAFPEWQGDLLVGALVDREVRRLDLEDGQVVKEEALFSEINARIRDLRQGPGGALYVLTDGKGGKLIRISR